MKITSHLSEKKYVAYLDVLGFKDLVQSKGQKLDVYFETVQEALTDISNEKSKIKSQLISDSIILACDLNNEALRLLFKATQTIQSRCALQNIWLRGAISVGDIYFDRNLNIVVGNGLVNAYLLESHEEFPRIVIDPKIINMGFENKENFILEFNTSKPNNQYIKVPLIHDNRDLQTYIENDSLFLAFGERIACQRLENLEIICEHIRTELYAGQRNYKKYNWLKNYFRQCLITLPQYYFAGDDASNESRHEITQKILSYDLKFVVL